MGDGHLSLDPQEPIEHVLNAMIEAGKAKADELDVPWDELIAVSYDGKRGVEMGGTMHMPADAPEPDPRLVAMQFTVTLLLVAVDNARALGLPISIANMPGKRGQG